MKWTFDMSGMYEATPWPNEVSDDGYEPPNVEHLGETARQFDWLKAETEALAAVTRGFGRIVENAQAIDPEAPKPRKEPQRLSYTRKGKKRKSKKR
jgi:hypothetical protein